MLVHMVETLLLVLQVSGKFVALYFLMQMNSCIRTLSVLIITVSNYLLRFGGGRIFE
jgi:hypothetical protein